MEEGCGLSAVVHGCETCFVCRGFHFFRHALNASSTLFLNEALLDVRLPL